jgi:hypothetical protein
MDFAAADHRPHRTPARRDPPPRHARRGHASSGPSPPRPTRRRVRSAKGAQGLSAVTLLKTSMQRSQGLPVGLCNLPPRRRNRAKPSQIEPNRAKPSQTEPNRYTTSQIETTQWTSQRQVATGLSRNDSKWPGARLSHPLLLRWGRLGGRHSRQVECAAGGPY